MTVRLNYDQISTTYDCVRQPDLDVVTRLADEAHLCLTSVVLDIGCGTGNYADLLQRVTLAQVFGVEPSAGMLGKAAQKNPNVTVKQADAEYLPFEGDTFDLVYMTDVIHHIPHIDRMFAEIQRVLKPGGKVCIVTQSHAQIDARPITRFFPATAAVDKGWYPDIPQIMLVAVAQQLAFVKSEVQNQSKPIVLDDSFHELVKTKGYSMLRLISERDYQAGLEQLEHQLAQVGSIQAAQAGDTLIWFQK